MKTIGKNNIVIELSQEEFDLIRACVNAAQIRWMQKGETDKGFQEMAELAVELGSKIFKIQSEIQEGRF